MGVSIRPSPENPFTPQLRGDGKPISVRPSPGNPFVPQPRGDGKPISVRPSLGNPFVADEEGVTPDARAQFDALTPTPLRVGPAITRREDTISALPEKLTIGERLREVGRQLTRRTGENPFPVLGVAGSIVGMPAEIPFRTGAAIGQPIAETLMPEQTALAREQGILPEHVTKEQAAILAAQTATLGVAGPAGSMIGRALAPAIGSRAAALVARTAVGAGAGSVFMPEDPAVGAIIGGTAGAVHAGVTGERALATRLIERDPGATRATARVPGRMLPSGPDYEVTANKPAAAAQPAQAAPQARVPSLAAPEMPKLLPRLRPMAPEESAATAASVAPRPAVRPTPVSSSYLPESEVALPAAVLPRARTPAGSLMSLRKATDEQLVGEYRHAMERMDINVAGALYDESGEAAQARALLTGKKGRGRYSGREDAAGVVEPEMRRDMGMANRQFEMADAVLRKVEAEIDRRGLSIGDDRFAHVWAATQGLPDKTTLVYEESPTYGAGTRSITPEQRTRFEAMRAAAQRALEVGKRRQAELEKPAGLPDILPALEREGRVEERKGKYLKTAPSLFAPDNPSMFEGPANMDETSVGKRAVAPVEPEPPRPRNAAELTASEDQGRLFEPTRPYGVSEARARYALQAAGAEGFPARLYSRTARAIDAAPFEKGTPQQWQAHLSKNVPASEREHSGLDAFLTEHKTGTLTRQQVAEAFNAGRIRLTETTLGGRMSEEDVLAGKAAANQPRFKNWTEPGGENYAERILSLQTGHEPEPFDPDKLRITRDRISTTQGSYTIHYPGMPATTYGDKIELSEAGWQGLTDEQIAHTARAQYHLESAKQTAYTSSHWPGIRNPLIHVRTSDRVLPNGEKALLVEEIQSDWHQKGRKSGYKPAGFDENAVNEEINALNRELSRIAAKTQSLGTLAPADKAEYDATMVKRDAVVARYVQGKNGVPDAPLKKTEQWAELGLKKAIDEAVRGGYDRVVWVNGETQAARYDLSKHVDELRYNPQTETLTASKGGHLVHEGKYDARALAEVVGKDAADKLLAQPLASGATERVQLEKLRVDAQAELEKMRGEHPEDKVAHAAMMEVREPAFAAIERADRMGFDTVPEALRALRVSPNWPQDWELDNPAVDEPLIAKYLARSAEVRDLEQLQQRREEPIRERIAIATRGLQQLHQVEGTHQLKGADLKIGGAGMKAFYDKILPNIVKDYAKSLGVKLEVEPVSMGKSALSAKTIQEEGENMGERGRFENRASVLDAVSNLMDGDASLGWREAMDVLEKKRAYPITETQGAREWLERYEKDHGFRAAKTFQSFKVTPELRAKVAGEGQRIAEPKPNYDQLDAFTPQQLDAFSTPAERDARAVRVYGSVRKAARAIALVKEHAGKFATTYPTGAATPAGRLRKIGERPTTGSLVHLIGQSLNTPEAIAQALYPFRSPLAERFIVIGHAVDPGPGGGLVSKVTSATMDTAGAIDSFAPYGGGYKGLIRFAEEIAARLKRTGATEVDLVHNHPSGVVQESTADKLFLQGVGAYLYHKHGITVRGMGVMDHNKARWLYPDNTKAHGVGSYEVEVKPSGIDWTSHTKQVGPDEVLQIVGPGGGNGGLHVLYLDTQLQHLALEAHNPSALKTMGGSALPGRTDKVPGWLEAHAKGLGSGDVVLVGPAGSAEEIYAAVQAAGTHIRVRDIMTMSVGPDGKPTYTSEVQNGTIDSDNGISTARSGVAERQAHRGLAESIAPYGTARRNASTLREPSAEYGRGPEYRKARAAGIASGLTPEQADAYAAAAKDIDFDGAKAIAQAKLEAGGFRTRLRRWADSAADQTRAIDVLSRAAVARGMPKGLSPEYQLALSYNSSNTIERALFDAPAMATTHGILDPITREPMGPTLESVCEPLGEKPEKIRQGFTYAVSLRKVGRGLQGTAGDANQLQAALDAVQQLGKIPANREFARRLGVFVDGIGTYAVRSGLWTDQFWQKLKYSDILYITFGRLMTHMKRPEPSVTYGVKRANLTPGVMPFEGSRRVIKNPVEALAGYAAMIIRRSDAARVGSSVIDAILQYMGEEGKAILTPLAANDPAVKAFAAAAIRQNLARMGLDPAEAGMVADLSAPQIDPHNPVIWRNRKGGPAQVPPEQTNVFGEEEPFETGEREYFLLHQPDIYKALIATRADSPLGDWVIMKGFRMGRRIMTVTTTGINPRFALGLNIARDIPQAIMQVPGIRPDDIAAAFLEAAKTVAGQSEFADILARHGLGNASIYAHDINPEAAARRIAPVTQLQKIGAKTRHIVGWPLEMAERIGAASDLVARLAAARAVRRNALKAGATQRDALAAAATSGLRSTVNFNRRAGTRGMQFLEQSVPFFGASTRSIVRSTEAIDEVPGRVLGAIAIVTLAVLSEWAISKNDKERRARQVDRPASERSRFIQFGSYRWPLSQEMAVVAAGVRMGLAQFTKDDPDSAEQLVQAIYNLLPPVASDLVQGDFVAPWPGWREVQEVAQNRQAYGNRPIVPERLADLRPAMRRQPSTAPTFDVLAAGARKFAIIVPPLAETSPLAVEHVVRGFFNNMTPLLTMVTDAALKATPIGKELEVRVPMPLLQHPLMPTSAFVMREPPSRTSSETWFYDKMREFNQGESAERTVGKMEDLAETPAGAKRAERARRLGGGSSWGLDEERAADVGLVFKEAQLNLREYRELETEVRQWVNDGRLTPKAARSLLDSLTTERQHMLRETRKALELLGVPSGLRSSAETRAAPADTSAAKVPVKLTAPRMLNREP